MSERTITYGYSVKGNDVKIVAADQTVADLLQQLEVNVAGTEAITRALLGLGAEQRQITNLITLAEAGRVFSIRVR